MNSDDKRCIERFEAGLDVIVSLGGSVKEMKKPIINLFKKSLPSVAGMELVEYIGNKGSYTDCLYNTGTWTKGKAKRVSKEQAVKLLKHPDVYREYTLPVDIIHDNIDETPPQSGDESKSSNDKLSFDQKKEIFNNQLLAMSDPKELRAFSKERLSGFEPDARLKDLSKIRELIMAHIGALGEGALP